MAEKDTGTSSQNATEPKTSASVQNTSSKSPSNNDYLARNSLAETESASLLSKIALYDNNLDKELIIQAVAFAIHHHGTQKRHSGDPYYHHPIAVAEILAEMKLDYTTIITGLLHDTVEDTDVTTQDIEEIFGADIANLVDGVTKLTKIKLKSANQQQADNFRKFLIAISQDIRVLIVKLADRLHNMRTLKYINKPEKRKRIATETMDIYAPLAERIGMHNIKNELQSIAFEALNLDGYNSVIKRLEYLQDADNKRIERTINVLLKLLEESSIKAEISGRIKSPYSIWSKMQSKNITFEKLSDIIAFRILVETKQECYQALGAIHSSYHMIPGKFKDFISTPKANGYQSVHTVVMGPEQQSIEIQIRTHEMHDISELGLAAHWSYKQGSIHNLEGKQYRWLRKLLEIIENTSEADDILENTRLEMYHDQVFCFTPQGDLIALPKKATPVDFAFAVHSEVGRSCVGAKINSRIVPLRTHIKNGDQIEILQSKSQAPLESWQNFAVTGKAQSEIKRTLRIKKREESINLGKELLDKSLEKLTLKLSDEVERPLLEHFKKESMDSIYEALGEGKLNRNEIINIIFPNVSNHQSHENKSIFSRFGFSGKKHKKSGGFIPISGVNSGMAINFSDCCNPLPEEKIAGIQGDNKGVNIHKISCPNLEEFIDKPELWVDVFWENPDKIKGLFPVKLYVVLKHKNGSLAAFTKGIANAQSNINNLAIVERASDFFELIVEIEVQNVDNLENIIKVLKSTKYVHSVKRYIKN